MAMNVSLVLQANAAQAKAELAATAGELKKVGAAASGLDQSTRAAAQGTRALETAAAAAATDLRIQGQAAVQTAGQNTALAQSSRAAAGAVGNMTAQWNDVIMMMAAGQNPIQLAIQQGTQITQTFGNAGAAGAFALVKDGFLSMISPINLITIGTIALGAAAVQWFTSAGEEVVAYSDRIEDLANRTKQYAELATLAVGPTDELISRFGQASVQVRQLIADMAELELREAQRATKATSAALQEELQLYKPYDLGSQVQLAEVFDFSIWDREARKAINSVLAGFGDLDQAGTLKKQIAAAEELRRRFETAAEASGEISGVEDQALARINEAILKMRELEGAQWQVARAKFDATYLDPVRETIGKASNRAVEITATAELLAKYQEEAELKKLINQYGEDSAQVATFRVQAERDALVEQLESLRASEKMKDAVLAAWDAANGIASVDMAGNIALAANEAGRLVDNMARVAGIQREQARNSVVIFDPRDPRYDPQRANMARMGMEPNRNIFLDDVPPPAGSSGAGSRSSGGGRSEVDEVQKLIDAKQRELDVLRTSDPVQKEMLRHREALAKATGVQRQELQSLIDQLQDESAAQELQNSLNDWFYDIARNAESAGDAIDMLKKKLIEASIEALMLGSGPLAGLFGTKGTSIGGMLLGGLLGGGKGGTGSFGLPLPFADGGMIHGEGGPRDDKKLIAASPGEFVVNGRATAKHRALLELLNAGGSLPRFATGGMIGGEGAAFAGGLAPSVSIPVSIDARGSQRGVGEEIAEALARVMPDIERRAVAAVSRAQRQGRL